MKNDKTKLVLWVYKKFFGKVLDPQKDKILIENMITFFEAIEEIAEKERRLSNMFKF